MKLCTIVGARPQFIKAAVVSRAIAAQNAIKELIIHTGQHYDDNMSNQFFNELNIPKPAYNLNIGSSSHGKQTGEMLIAIEDVLLKEKPDWVLVYGDTNSTLAGALAAAKLNIPVAHVEAGLRSFNRKMPEEINRVTTDHLSTLLFAPTETSYKQLLSEGISAEKVHNVGDVMYDAALYYNELNANRTTLVDILNLKKKEYVLTTIHRAENTDSELRIHNIVNALVELSHETQVVFPLHPRTKKALEQNGLLTKLENHLTLIDPVGYLDMMALEHHAKMIVTDSGGVQKEAYFNQVPCVTLRDETEWVELVESGWNILQSPGTSFKLSDSMHSDLIFELHKRPNLYGKGVAASLILDMWNRSIGYATVL